LDHSSEPVALGPQRPHRTGSPAPSKCCAYIYRGAPTVNVRDLNNMFMNMQEQSQSSAAPAIR